MCGRHDHALIIVQKLRRNNFVYFYFTTLARSLDIQTTVALFYSSTSVHTGTHIVRTYTCSIFIVHV